MNLPARARLFPFAWVLFVSMTAPARVETLTEQTALLPSDTRYHQQFGYSLATSGDTAIVGAPGSVAAYIFIRRGSSWFQQAKLQNPLEGFFSQFGSIVAISGDTAIVSTRSCFPYPWCGAVYVFVRTGSSWQEQARLLAPHPKPDGDGFGSSVAIAGDTIAVGADTDDNTPSRPRTGAVYVFVRSGSIWSLQAKLLASDGNYNDSFGRTVAIAGDTLIVGAPDHEERQGAAYVFRRDGSSWSDQAKLLASGGEPSDGFGSALAISGDTAVVGSSLPDTGAVYVFVGNGSNWSEQTKLLVPDGWSLDYFGQAVAISGDTAAVGAFGHDHYLGAAFIFVRRGSSWFEQAKLVASSRTQLDAFGHSVAISGATALVGAPGADFLRDEKDAGVVYAFSTPGVIVTPAGPFTIEGGGTAAFTVALGSEPTGDVVIDLASSNTEEGTVWPERLTFATGDWSTPQTVTLTGVDDFVDDNGQPYMAALHMNQELTEDELYDGIDPEDVPAVNLEFAGDFYLVPACRVLDTRQPEQRPPLTSGVDRVVEFHNVCGVPASARAVAINVTVVQPIGRGHLALYPSDLPPPGPATLSFFAWRMRANNATVLLATDGTGTLTVAPYVEGLGTVHLIIDVAGYFE